MKEKYKLIFQIDYSADSCLWPNVNHEYTMNRFGYGSIDEIDESSPETFELMRELSEEHETVLDRYDLDSPQIWSKEKCANFNRKIDEVIHRIRIELGPGYEVTDGQSRMED